MCVCVCMYVYLYNIHVKMNLPIRISKYTEWNEQKVTSRLIKCCQSLIVYNTKVAPSGMYKVPTVNVYESSSLIINALWHIDNVRFYKRIFINDSSTVEKNTQNDVINLDRSRTKWNRHNKVIITDRYPEWEFCYLWISHPPTTDFSCPFGDRGWTIAAIHAALFYTSMHRDALLDSLATSLIKKYLIHNALVYLNFMLSL